MNNKCQLPQENTHILIDIYIILTGHEQTIAILTRNIYLFIYSVKQEAIRIDEMRVTFIVGGLRIHLDNLFNGNKVLSASLNMFLNQNAHDVLSELKSDLEHGLEAIFTVLWNKLFNKMPLKLWLL